MQTQAIPTHQPRYFFKYGINGSKAELFIPVLAPHKDGESKYRSFERNNITFYSMRLEFRSIDGLRLQLYSYKHQAYFPTFRYVTHPAIACKADEHLKFGESPFRQASMGAFYYSNTPQGDGAIKEKCVLPERKGEELYSCLHLYFANNAEEETRYIAIAKQRLAKCITLHREQIANS